MRDDGWNWIGCSVYHWDVDCSIFEAVVESLLRELRRLESFFLLVPILELPSAFCSEVVDRMCERDELLFLQKIHY